MADVIHVPALGEQLRIIQQLRWRLFRNRLRTASARLGLIGSILIGLVYLQVSVGLGAGIGFGSFALVRGGDVGYLSGILWGIFLLWQVFPVMTLQAGGGFDARSLIRFPLRLSSYCALNLGQILGDPIALCGIFWHGCLWLGVTIARPDAWWGAAIALALSVCVNVLFGQMATAWTERLLAQRRTREIALALFVLSMICLQFARAAVRNAAGPAIEFLHRTSAVWDLLPPGLAGTALRQSLGGQFGGVVLAWSGLAAYGGLFALLLINRLRAEYSGEYFSETAAPGMAPRVARARPSAPATSSGLADRTGWLGGPVGAVFLKEVRYLYRNTLLAIALLTPLILVAAISANRALPRYGAGHWFRGEYAYAGIMAYTTSLLMARFSMNSLGYDGGGVQLMFLMPVPFRTVMLGKNALQGVLVAIEALLAWGLMRLLSGPLSFFVLALTWTGLLFLTLTGLSVGNWLSLRFPQKVEFGMRNQRASGWPALIYLVAFAASMVLLAGVGGLAGWLVGGWLIPVAYALLDVGAVVLYRVALEMTSAQAIKRRETIIEALVR